MSPFRSFRSFRRRTPPGGSGNNTRATTRFRPTPSPLFLIGLLSRPFVQVGARHSTVLILPIDPLHSRSRVVLDRPCSFVHEVHNTWYIHTGRVRQPLVHPRENKTVNDRDAALSIKFAIRHHAVAGCCLDASPSEWGIMRSRRGVIDHAGQL